MILLWIALFFNLALASNKNKTYPGTYVIIAPNQIRPGLPYSASVKVLQNEPMTVEMIIQDDQNKTIVKSSQSDIKKDDLKIISMDKIPTSLEESTSYHLRVKGYSSRSPQSFFDEIKPLYLDMKYFSIFIQTDKATYKPGATMNFRVIVVDPNLKPIQGKANIKISDPQDNVIKQFLDQSLEHGIIGKNGTLSLELSDEPLLGSWKIDVEINGQHKQKNFQVEKYVLPKFDVKLETPPFILFDHDYNLTVTAKYTYGKGVVGNALITLFVPRYWGPDENKMSKIIRTLELNKDGQASLLITNQELLENRLITNESYYYVYINAEASVTETLSGTQRNETSYTSVYKENYVMSIEKKSDSFHPGMDFEFTVKVTGHDDKPLPVEDHQPVNVSISYSLSRVAKGNDSYEWPTVQTNQIVKVNAEGSATVKVTTPHNATHFYISTRYINEKEGEECYRCPSGFDYVSAVKSPSDSYIELVHGEVENIKVGETVSMIAKTNADFDSVTVQIMNKNRVVFFNNVKITNKMAEIKIQTNTDMTPSARVIVYSVQTQNKEIIVDALDLYVDGIFRNNISIEANPKRVEPNSTVALKVKASPKSYVGLLAIDKSVILLRSGNDITKSEVESEMSKYGSGVYPYFWFGEGRGRQKRSHHWWSVSGSDAASIFDNSGVLVITDALLYRYNPDEEEEGKQFAAGPQMPPGGAAGAPAPAPRSESLSAETGSVGGTEPQIRSRFLETWIWADAVVGENGEVIYKTEAPDTITSFVATAFAIHDTDGFSVADEPANIEVFRPFFIRLDLPYSVKRGEKLALHLIVFNYGNKEQTVTVTLDHDDKSGFDFIDKTGSVKNSKDKDKPSNTRLVKIPADGGSASIYFPIRPTKIGKLKMLVKAFGQSVSDAVEDYLLVEAEGYALYFNKPFGLDNSSRYVGSNATKLDFPADIVPGSQKVSITVVGDMMSNLLNNIDNLIQMPSGCGEQNMLHFVPNIVINKYLKATNRLTPHLDAQTTRYMESGYQRELTYQLEDSSFSAFGKQDKNGSTWLTAFVVKSFSQAKPYIFIDDANLNKSLDFLLSKKKENGAFAEDGHVHDKGMQGGAGEDNLAASAYVFISLLMNNRTSPETLSFLERSLDRISNNSYALAIVTYAFHLAESSKKDQALKMLEKIAIKKDKSIHWSQTVTNDEDKHNSRWWWWRPRPADIETTSYVLLTYLRRNDLKSAMPIFQWLSQQQNAFGGFSSTQDTVVALQALGELAEKMYTGKNDLVVTVENGGKTFTIPITHDNALIQQTYPLPNINESISIKTSGHGSAFGQISWHYNILNLENIKPFTCTKEVNQSTGNYLKLSICCKYNLKGSSNMAVMEIDAMSGFSIETDKLNLLVSHIDQIQRVESVYGDSKANVYFFSLNSVPVCFDARMQRYYSVVDQKPAVVKLYDYYNPSERTEFEYNTIINSTLQDVCGFYCMID